MEDAELDCNVDVEKLIADKHWATLASNHKKVGLQEGVFAGRQDDMSLKKYFNEGFHEILPLSERIGRLQGIIGTVQTFQSSTLKTGEPLSEVLTVELSTLYTDVSTMLYLPIALKADRKKAVSTLESLEKRVSSVLTQLGLPVRV
eukprot:CFRG7024T1